jgi:hypothetical protein
MSGGSSVVDVNYSRTSSVTSMSFDESDTRPSIYSEAQIAVAIMTDRRCKAALEGLSKSVDGHLLEHKIASVLKLLARDFRDYASGERDLALQQLLQQHHELLASIMTTIIETGKLEVSGQTVDKVDSTIAQEDEALVFFLASPAVWTFTENVEKIKRNADPSRKPLIKDAKLVSITYTCVSE